MERSTRAPCVFVPLLLLADPALGAEPAYVGKWAEMADAKCPEPLLITATTLEALGGRLLAVLTSRDFAERALVDPADAVRARGHRLPADADLDAVREHAGRPEWVSASRPEQARCGHPRPTRLRLSLSAGLGQRVERPRSYRR